MAGTFNTTSVTEIILKLPVLNHTAGREHVLKNFNSENINITWQEISNSMKPPNCMAQRKLTISKCN